MRSGVNEGKGQGAFSASPDGVLLQVMLEELARMEEEPGTGSPGEMT